jgi:hypothetical protein
MEEEMKLYEVRTGPFGDVQADFNANGVRDLGNNTIELALTKDEDGNALSAGVTLGNAGDSDWEIQVNGFDTLGKDAVFAVWARCDDPESEHYGREIDFAEVTAMPSWGLDELSILSGYFDKPGKYISVYSSEVTGTDTLTLSIQPKDRNAWYNAKSLVPLSACTLKVALWANKETPYREGCRVTVKLDNRKQLISNKGGR